jgi:hypothetical protein
MFNPKTNFPMAALFGDSMPKIVTKIMMAFITKAIKANIKIKSLNIK